MSVSIETIEKARRKGAIIKEVPISCSHVPSPLNFGVIRHGLGVALVVVRIRLKSRLLAKIRNEADKMVSGYESGELATFRRK